ncbi:MAG: hypothetical protein HY781_11880 [Chloroflexi bacterium]|nr:hypothetical protein [Chloroflexota bacterium]
MRKYVPVVFLALALALLLAACGEAVDAAAAAVENYLNALVAKDADSISALSCADWEPQALLELDSLQAVETRLEGLACTSTTEEDGSISVNCVGKILATYNGEDQELDLSVRTYVVTEQGGEYLVCGYR